LGHEGQLLINKEIYIGRFVDAEDSDHEDGTISMADTAVDGPGGTARHRPIERRGVPFEIKIENPTHFPTTGLPNEFIFDPISIGQKFRTDVSIQKPGGGSIGTLRINGDAVMQEYFIDERELQRVLERLADGTITGTSAGQRAF